VDRLIRKARTIVGRQAGEAEAVSRQAIIPSDGDSVKYIKTDLTQERLVGRVVEGRLFVGTVEHVEMVLDLVRKKRLKNERKIQNNKLLISWGIKRNDSRTAEPTKEATVIPINSVGKSEDSNED